LKNEKITLGGGCFWCLEAIFSSLNGVESVVSGYAGGQTESPSYKDVCTGNTGHAEVIQIEFKPELITMEDILDVFWQAHDPTSLNRQDNDVGTQYRSTIMPHNEQQQEAAQKSMEKWKGKFNSPITTIIEPLNDFFEAEENHQDYFRLNPKAPYCALSIEPKLKKLKDDNVLP
jgi:peptide-methionine (S)-S-oxide reductase